MHAASLSLRHVLVLVRFTLTGLTPGISTLLLRIQGEYRERPGLQLTEAQARRLWDFEGNTCSLVAATLLEQRFLKRTPSGTSDSCTAVRRIRPM
jgi:hypothetical protein